MMPDTENQSNNQQLPDSSKEKLVLDEMTWRDLLGNTLFHDVENYRGKRFFTFLRRIPNSSVLDVQNEYGQTPLHMATRSRRADIVRTLVCAGADTRIQDCFRNTPLHVAVTIGDIVCVRALTSPVTPEEIQKVNLLYVPIIPPISLPEDHGAQGYTCLHIATIGGHVEILKYLVEDLETNVDVTDLGNRNTALHFACYSGAENVVRCLLEMGAFPSSPNVGGVTPYRCAARYPSIQNILFAYGADPDVFPFVIEDDVEDDDFNATANLISATTNQGTPFPPGRS